MKNARYRTVDLLKGASVVAVVAAHFPWTTREMQKLLFPFFAFPFIPILMIISGFLYAGSFSRHGVTTVKEAYRLRDIVNKMVRYTAPYFLVFVALTALDIGLNGTAMTPRRLLFRFLNGGNGLGGYYYPLMMQFIFICPAIYLIIRKYDFKGLVFCAFLNAAFEVVRGAFNMSQYAYKFMIFRFLMVIAFGCWLAVGRNKKRITAAVLSAIVGGIWVYICGYRSYKPVIFNFWVLRNFMSFFWAMPMAGLLILTDKVHFPPLEYLGKYSYDIYLIQMVYYNVAVYVYRLIDKRSFELLANIAICVAAGILFHYVEKPFTDFVGKKALAWVDRREKAAQGVKQ